MKAFKITDPDYSDRMPLIMSVLLATECDLRGDALDFLISRKKNMNVDAIEEILTRMATHHASLRLFADAEGIDFAELEACAPPRHPAVATLLERIAGDEDEKEAAEFAACLRKLVDQDS